MKARHEISVYCLLLAAADEEAPILIFKIEILIFLHHAECHQASAGSSVFMKSKYRLIVTGLWLCTIVMVVVRNMMTFFIYDTVIERGEAVGVGKNYTAITYGYYLH